MHKHHHEETPWHTAFHIVGIELFVELNIGPHFSFLSEETS